MTLSVIFYPYHFVRAILSIPFCPMPFCPYTILSIPFCPYHFVRYHFVLEPLKLLATWVTQVYLPMFYEIKVKHDIKYGPWHLIKLFRLCAEARCMGQECLKAIPKNR